MAFDDPFAPAPREPPPPNLLTPVPAPPRYASSTAERVAVRLGAFQTLSLYAHGAFLLLVLVLAAATGARTWHDPPSSLLVVAVAGCILVVGGRRFSKAARSLRHARRRERAFSAGTAVVGTVVSFGPAWETRAREKPRTKLVWWFTDARGEQHRGSLTTATPEDVGPREAGDPIVVLYDPDNPKTSTLWIA